MLSAGGKESQDWSAAYRIFEKGRVKQKELFSPAIEGVLENTGEHDPLYAMMDDTLVRKRGRKVSGACWKRDPLGPAFHTNFVWGQRYLQISAALPDFEVEGRARHPSRVPSRPNPGQAAQKRSAGGMGRIQAAEGTLQGKHCRRATAGGIAGPNPRQKNGLRG